MKHTVIFSAVFALLIFLSPEVKSQLRINLKEKISQEANRRANDATDRSINAGFDKVEQGVKDIFKKKDKNSKNSVNTENSATEEGTNAQPEDQPAAAEETSEASPVLSWSKYDFVPGDQVIFEDNLLNEENGEFPSRWDHVNGNIEVAEFGGEKVIMMRTGQPTIVPYFKDPGEDHLPDVFTVELDLYYPGSGSFEIFLYDRKNQESGSPSGYTDVEVCHGGNSMQFSSSTSYYPGRQDYTKGWMHISIAYTTGKLKAYMDDTRLINIPRIDFDPKGITLYTYHASDQNLFFVKNIRIAKGGVKYYDRVMQDGKIIVNGIRFDVNKATLKPESMGVINEIAALMKEHPEISFSVEGHTDSDGDDAFNQTLSEQRAGTVVSTLTEMGIDAGRMTAKGWGENKPLDTNASPEGKANNRRVEFVKI